MKYLIKYERANDGGWCAYSPDLPGVGIGANTREEARVSIEKAIKLHLDGLREDGFPIPPPSLCEDIKYPVIYEHAEHNWCAYPPDLPGVGITAKTREAARASIEKAIKMHLDGMREDGLPIPPPSLCEYIKYPVIFERANDGGWGAYPPDLPGVGIVASTYEAARVSIEKAIKMHLDGMREDGLPIPPPSETEYVEVVA